jgi:hypothetical protein
LPRAISRPGVCRQAVQRGQVERALVCASCALGRSTGARHAVPLPFPYRQVGVREGPRPSPPAIGHWQNAGATVLQRGRVSDPPLGAAHDSRFAIAVAEPATAQQRCAPTVSAGYCARVWNRLRQPRLVAAGRVENPPLPRSHQSRFAIRYSRFAVSFHSPFAVFFHSRFAGALSQLQPGGFRTRPYPDPTIRDSPFAVSFHSRIVISRPCGGAGKGAAAVSPYDFSGLQHPGLESSPTASPCRGRAG